ncbi:MAG: hypothetical protein ACOCX5_00190 [Chloroflexota bacterium]
MIGRELHTATLINQLHTALVFDGIGAPVYRLGDAARRFAVLLRAYVSDGLAWSMTATVVSGPESDTYQSQRAERRLP